MAGQNEKLGIMHAILTLERAGAQEVVRTLAKNTQEKGHRVMVCAFQDGPMRAEIEKLGVPVEIIRRPRHSVVLLPIFLVEMLRIQRELARLVYAYRVDLLQAHLLDVLDFLVLSLRPTTRLRAVLWTKHSVKLLPNQMPNQGQWLHKLKSSGYRLLYRWLSRYVDGFAAVSDEVRRSILEEFGPKEGKVFTIYNGVDLRQFDRPGDKEELCAQLGLEPHSCLIATVGRLASPKGHRSLLEAAESVVSRLPDAHFLVIGDGTLRTSLEGQAESKGLGESVHFLGIREDIADLLAAVDLFVLPSLWEGLPIALLEAMAAAKPIVATAIPGTLQAMIPGETGLVVPPGDSQAMADAIMWLVRHPAQAEAMGRVAREHVETGFSAEKLVSGHLALYRRLLHCEERP